jgi:hypothetical protein
MEGGIIMNSEGYAMMQSLSYPKYQSGFLLEEMSKTTKNSSERAIGHDEIKIGYIRSNIGTECLW